MLAGGHRRRHVPLRRAATSPQALEARSTTSRSRSRSSTRSSRGEPTTALVLGYDKRAGVEAGETGHSDTLMLVRADPDLETVTMLSFPRDLIAEIHGCRNRHVRRRGSTTPTPQCGSTAAIETVRHLTGLPINFLVTVNFRGFKQVVSHLGGVWIDVDRRYYNPPGTGLRRDRPPARLPEAERAEGARLRPLPAHRLGPLPPRAPAAVRQGGEAARLRLPACSSCRGLVKSVTTNVEVGKGDGTRFDADTIIDYALFAYQLPPGTSSRRRSTSPATRASPS